VNIFSTNYSLGIACTRVHCKCNRRQTIELTIQIFEITVEVTFPMPRSFAKDRLDYDALWLTNIAEGFVANLFGGGKRYCGGS
jgi:hypothetical protein